MQMIQIVMTIYPNNPTTRQKVAGFNEQPNVVGVGVERSESLWDTELTQESRVNSSGN
jgi:hypothetical protein